MSVLVEASLSLEDYHRMEYDLEVEFVDGALSQRHVGGYSHSLTQSNLICALHLKYPHLKSLPSLSIQTTPTRHRIIDICVLIEREPFLAIEILSEDDRTSATLEKLEEYARKGVPHIWVIDPRLRTMSTFSDGTLREIRDDVIATANPRLELTRDEILRD